jgi:hypothetical protein
MHKPASSFEVEQRDLIFSGERVFFARLQEKRGQTLASGENVRTRGGHSTSLGAERGERVGSNLFEMRTGSLLVCAEE